MTYDSDGPIGGRPSPVVAAAYGNRLAFVQKVYGLFLAGIVVSALAAGYVVTGPQLQHPDVDGTALAIPIRVLAVVKSYWVVIVGFFATFLIANVLRRRPGINLVMMFVFTAVSGVMIAPRLWIATALNDAPNVVPMAFTLTTLMFAGLTVYAAFSKRDFNFLGAGLFVALLGLILGSLLNGLFFHSPWAYLFMAWFAVVIFSGYVLYDTQRILVDLAEEEYVAGALSLYLDFINLFLALLRIFGGGRD